MKSYAIAMLAIMMLSAFAPAALKVPVAKAISYYSSEFSFMEPKIDGVVSWGEWDGAAKISLGYGFMMFQNDASSLYILLDVIGDTYNDPPLAGSPWGDFFWLTFDVNVDEVITPYVDVNYNTFLGTYNLGKQYYLGAGSWTGLYTTASALGAGFGPSINSAASHRFWEFAISLPEISAVPNDLIRLGVMTYSQNPSFTDEQPVNFYDDFSNLIEIALAREQVDLLVLAHEDFLDALVPFKAHKDYTGIITCVQSWQRLDESFGGQGSDEPERIKRAIAQYEYYCDVRWVMLVGDCDKFPVRYCKAYNTEWGSVYYPSDLYYADLYDSSLAFDDWDYDNDGIYGEMDFAGGENINLVNLDRINMYPDVMVGRVPASTSSEVTTYVNKVIGYEFSAYRSNWFNKAMWITDGPGAGSFGAPEKKDRLDSYLTGFTLTKRYNTPPWDTATYEQRAAEINTRINEGQGFVNYFGHGNTLSWAGWYDSDKITGLTNEGMLPIMFAVSCYTGRFHFDVDYYMDVNNVEWNSPSPADHPKPKPVQPSLYDMESMAEYFLVKDTAGAVAYIGCTSKNEYGGEDLDKYFFEAYYYSMKPPTLGSMWNYAMYQFLTDIVVPRGMWYYAFLHIHKVMLFGDPSLRVGGISSIQKEDFLGTYDMDHDGWKGVLELRANPDDPIEMIPNIVGTYTVPFGPVHDVYGWVRTWKFPIYDGWGPDWQIELYIDFYDTPTTADDQEFLGCLSTGTRDVIAGTTWWSGMPFEFYALKRGTTGSMLFDSSRASWRIIYPAQNTPKPLGCLAAWVSDWLASMAISTKLTTYTEGLDTDGAYVNQITGRPMGAFGEGIVSFGGPVVNPVVRYAESDSTNLFDRAPIRFHDEGGSYYFQHWNGESIPGASLPISSINGDEDMFVIETYEDADGRIITLCYGFGWQGTYAAGKYFQETVYPNPTWFEFRWIILKWQDTNGDGFVNTHVDGDTYTVIAWGF